MKNLDSILPISDEGLYPIRTVSEVSGVNSITLRAWERRYDLFKPKRSPKGHRLYSDKDIQRVHQVLALLDKGVSIGRVAKALKADQTVSNLPTLSAVNSESIEYKEFTEIQSSQCQDELFEKIRTYDIFQLESFHHDLLSKYSIESISLNLIIPVLKLLDDNAKQLPSISSEYNFYRIFILYRIGGLCLKTSINNRGKKLLLMGLANEHCDVELLLFAMPLLQRGYQIVTLGCNVSLDSIPMSLLSSNAEGLMIYSDINKSDSLSTKTLETIVNNVNQPVFITEQSSDIQKKQLQESGVIILPSASKKQTILIEKNINKTPQ